MTVTQLFFGILVCLIILLFIITITTLIVTKITSKEIANMHNVYLGRLANSDDSIQDAMKYLKLTNSIEQQLNGEEDDENTSR